MWCSQHSITQTEGWDGGLWVSAPTTLTETQAPSVSWLPLFPGTWRQQVRKDNEDGTWEVFRARPGRGTHHARSHAITQDAVTWPPKCRRLGNGVSAHTEGRGHGKRRGQGVDDAQLAGLSRGKSLTREEGDSNPGTREGRASFPQPRRAGVGASLGRCPLPRDVPPTVAGRVPSPETRGPHQPPAELPLKDTISGALQTGAEKCGLPPTPP